MLGGNNDVSGGEKGAMEQKSLRNTGLALHNFLTFQFITNCNFQVSNEGLI